MIVKGRSPTMRHVARTHIAALDWLFESIWTPRSKSNTLTPRTNSQTCWQREISHVMNGIIFCVCSKSAISVPPIVLKWCRKERKKMHVKKESQQNRSRWWIWSRDATQGILKCLPRLHQKARGKPDLKVNYLWARGMSSKQERGRPVMGASSSDYSEWNIDEKWSSQVRKSGEMLEARTGRPVGGHPFSQHTNKFVIDDNDMDSDTITESNLSPKSRSFLHRVNDRLRKILDPVFKRCNARHRQTFFNLVNVYVFNIGSICIHGKELLRQFTFHQKYREQSHDETDVRHIWKIDSRTIRWDFWSDSN